MFRPQKKKGPFEAKRILDTPEVKLDQVYTRADEKPIALLIHLTTEEARKIDAQGFVGPTGIEAKSEYEKGKTWVTRGIYWPANIPGAQFDENILKQLTGAAASKGTVIPDNITFERIEDQRTIPISGSAVLETASSGVVMVHGSVLATKPTKSTIQINSAPKGETAVSIQLITPGLNPKIVALYITKAAGGEVKNEALTLNFPGPASGDVLFVPTPSTHVLATGDVVKTVCADGGATSTSVT